MKGKGMENQAKIVREGQRRKDRKEEKGEKK